MDNWTRRAREREEFLRKLMGIALGEMEVEVRADDDDLPFFACLARDISAWLDTNAALVDTDRYAPPAGEGFFARGIEPEVRRFASGIVEMKGLMGTFLARHVTPAIDSRTRLGMEKADILSFDSRMSLEEEAAGALARHLDEP